MGPDTGSTAAAILHIAAEVLTIVTLAAVAALAAILASWVAVGIVRKRRLARQQARLRPVTSEARPRVVQVGGAHGCRACGGTGTGPRAIGGRSYQDQPCPACQPAHRAG